MISTLLFVNNNTSAQRAVKDCLKKLQENIYLISAYSYEDAVNILSLVTPDAVLIDGDITGLQVYADIPNQVPFFVITENTGIQKEINDKRFTGINNKPTTDEEYTATLVKIIDSII